MFKIVPKLRVNHVNLIKHKQVNYSNKPMIKEKINYEEQLKEFEKISNVAQKIRTKKPQKPPFVKNLLLGIFDTDILTYPELQNEDLSNLGKAINHAKTVLERPEIKENNTLNKQFLKTLGENKLLGLQTSQLIGGRELNVTESCRFAEIFSEINLKNNIINNETLGIQTLLKFGSDRLKKKYLEKLVSGENLSAFCILEPLASNMDIIKRTAILSPDNKTWYLNGRKQFIVNGSDADVFVVFANTNSTIKDQVQQQKFTAFLVERDFGGITSSHHNTVDPNVQVSNVTFENTPVPAENVIGVEEKGESMLTAIYPEFRLSTGPVCTVLLKNLTDKFIEHFIQVSRQPFPLYETDALRTKLGELVSSTYAVESMVYLTAGLMDNYEDQDCELESTIVKVFASEQAFVNTSTCLDLIGIDANMENHWCSQLHKEAQCQVALNDCNDNLKIVIALFGIRYAGLQTKEIIKKLRNPLFYASFIFKRMWTNRRQSSDNPKLNLYLHHYLHPSLINTSQHLEYCVLRLQYATEVFLSRYGQEVVNRHADLRRLAECIIDIYAMTACLARASRSYCIGLQHSDMEMMLATSFTASALERVKTKLSKIIDGPYRTNDENYRIVSKRFFKFKKYIPVHPLTRNF